MISLCYVSSAVGRPTKEDLMSLLAECHNSNQAKNITGMLLYNGKGTYLQALEGEEKLVTDVFEVIRKDSRHTNVVRISCKPISERTFPTWKMGFRNLANQPTTTLEGYSDFMEEGSDSMFWQQNGSTAETLLSHFKQSTTELVF